jgi:hypothetical protein
MQTRKIRIDSGFRFLGRLFLKKIILETGKVATTESPGTKKKPTFLPASLMKLLLLHKVAII